MGVDAGARVPYLPNMRKLKRKAAARALAKNAAAQALAAMRMVKMTAEQRREVARKAGLASGRVRGERAQQRREAEATEPETVGA